MDARRDQVYNALFEVGDGPVRRLCDDRALSVAELVAELAAEPGPVVLIGDGAELVYAAAGGKLDVRLAPENRRYQRASRVAELGALLPAGPAGALTLDYLRLPQAVREKAQRNQQQETKGPNA